ncbi:uncharacterized protein LOC116845930 [Odontomachus brunneus]|uniref:uncharacterized protein LOC116845930 n=1 Tax=Odontomachus brunneus TaxID=486640 RepID=UPI0013F22BAF|nr:uncharacterized protein LOC116845930 [Odontomachus brunneus]
MSSYCEETDFAEYHYYKINQLLLSTFKLWPYRRSKFAIINHIINWTLLVSLVFFQLTSFLTYQCTMNFVITVLSFTMPSLISIILYCSFYTNPNAVRQIWKDIRYTWDILKNEAEREIMRKYSLSGQLFSTAVLLIVVMSLISYSVFQFTPNILNLMFPLNETRPHHFYAVTEYFVDEETYFYPLLCHWLIGVFVNFLIAITVFMLFTVYVEHICGMFSVASYRIEHSISQCMPCNLREKQDRMISRNIVAAMDIHRKALKCSSFLLTTFAPYFFLITVIGVISLSLNFFRVLNAITMQKNVNELFSPMMVICMCTVCMFIASCCGQKITDHSNKVFYNAYNTKWYEISTKTQKLFLFIMTNTTKEYLLCVGTIIESSIIGFCKLMSSSVSYFTVIYTLQLSEVQLIENNK